MFESKRGTARLILALVALVLAAGLWAPRAAFAANGDDSDNRGRSPLVAAAADDSANAPEAGPDSSEGDKRETSPSITVKPETDDPMPDKRETSPIVTPPSDTDDERSDAEETDGGTGTDGKTSSDADTQLQTQDDAKPVETVAMYRLYNPNSGEHFYTGDAAERDSVRNAGWYFEGVGWVAPKISNSPVFRLYNPNAGDHHYTLDAGERDGLVSLGWRYEGVGWYSDDNETIAVLRQYNPNAVSGAHNFTTSQGENDNLASVGWHPEGTGWYAVADGSTIVDAYGKSGYQNPGWMFQVSPRTVSDWWTTGNDIHNYVTPSRISASATRAEVVDAFVNRAYEYVYANTPYVWDYACAPGVGVDCSGLVLQCAYATGMNMGDMNPHNHYYAGLAGGYHAAYANALHDSPHTQKIPVSAVERGDVLWRNGHVAIYAGNGTIIEAYYFGMPVRTAGYNPWKWSAGVRLFAK